MAWERILTILLILVPVVPPGYTVIVWNTKLYSACSPNS